jgi:hypothetical protein
MSLQSAFCNYLGSQSTITDLLTNNGAADIFWTTVPEGRSLPVIVVQKISDSAEHYQGGAVSLAEARLQVTCMSDAPEEAEAIADAVRLKTDGMQNTTIGRVGDQVTVVNVRLENASEGVSTPQEGGEMETGKETGTPDVNMDFLIWYRATVPSF